MSTGMCRTNFEWLEQRFFFHVRGNALGYIWAAGVIKNPESNIKLLPLYNLTLHVRQHYHPGFQFISYLDEYL